LFVLLLLVPAPARGGRIVVLLSSEAAPYTQAEAGFEKAMGNRTGDCQAVQLKELMAKGIDVAVGKDAEFVVAIGTPAAVAVAGKLSSGTPMVFCMVAGASAQTISNSAATHGVSMEIPLNDQFKLIAQAIPSAKTLGMLYRSNTPAGQRLLKNVRDSLGPDWRVEAEAVDQASSVADAINDLTSRHVDVIWTSLDAGVYDAPTVHALLLAALRAKVPVFGFSPSFVRAGALLGVGVDPAAQGQQAATIVQQILGHTLDAGAQAVQAPASFQVAVNQIVADEIGVSLPRELVDRATFVFKDDK
jgi:putative ABC transport system substrate-binding protein